jgi:hypothetical protein
MDDLLIDYEHESIFSSYMLTLESQKITNVLAILPEELFKYKFTMNEIKIEAGLITEYTDIGCKLNKAEAALNYSLLKPAYDLDPELIKGPIYTIKEHGLLDKKGLTKLTHRYFLFLKSINESLGRDVLNFWDCIHEFDKFLLECSGSLSFCTPSFDMKDFVVQSDEISEFKNNLLTVEPFLAFHQNLVLFEKVKARVEEEPDNILNTVFKSGARLKSVQLLKAASNTGIPTDIYGKAFPANIKNSLLDGLTPVEYFTTGDSARLALAVRQEAIP